MVSLTNPRVRIQFDRNRNWSTQFRYISLFACETSHYLCTGTRAKANKLAVVSGAGVSFARPDCTEIGYLTHSYGQTPITIELNP